MYNANNYLFSFIPTYVTQNTHFEYFLLLTAIGFFGATKVSLILSDAVWIRQRPLEKFWALNADAVHSWSSKHKFKNFKFAK
jgi:hypothetical protein